MAITAKKKMHTIKQREQIVLIKKFLNYEDRINVKKNFLNNHCARGIKMRWNNFDETKQ